MGSGKKGRGAAGFGVLAGHAGYPVVFALTATVLPAALVVTRTSHRSEYGDKPV